MTYKLDLKRLKSFDPCWGALREVEPLFDDRKMVSLAAAAKAGVSLDNLLWVAGHMAKTDETLLGQIVQFARDAAATAQVGPGEPEPYWRRVVVVSGAVSSALIQGEPVTLAMQRDTFNSWADLHAAQAGRSDKDLWSDPIASATQALQTARWASVGGPRQAASAATSAAHWAHRAAMSNNFAAGDFDYRAMFTRLLTAPPVVR